MRCPRRERSSRRAGLVERASTILTLGDVEVVEPEADETIACASEGQPATNGGALMDLGEHPPFAFDEPQPRAPLGAVGREGGGGVGSCRSNATNR
jgi:hypothetical protein